MADRPPLTGLAAHERTLAFTRFEQLKPHLEDGVPLTRVAKAAGLPLRTAQRWVSHYRQHGLAGLVRPTRKDAGTHRLPAELQELIEGLALKRPGSRPPRFSARSPVSPRSTPGPCRATTRSTASSGS